jgi:hypothetical protein
MAINSMNWAPLKLKTKNAQEIEKQINLKFASFKAWARTLTESI